jgi:hypothetical protein
LSPRRQRDLQLSQRGHQKPLRCLTALFHYSIRN